MHVVAGLLGAALGVVVGPVLGGLTLRVPADDPLLSVGWWRGEPAGGRRRLLVTALCMVVLALVAGTHGAEPALPAYLWLGVAGVALAVIDLDCHRLPDVLTLPTYLVGLVLFGAAAVAAHDAGSYLRALAAMAAVFAVFFALAAVGGIGFGDTKLAGVLGLYLGWMGWGVLLVGLTVGFCVGAVGALGMLALRVAGWRTHFAFGPSLLLGALVAVAVGGPVLDAYVSGVAG